MVLPLLSELVDHVDGVSDLLQRCHVLGVNCSCDFMGRPCAAGTP